MKLALALLLLFPGLSQSGPGKEPAAGEGLIVHEWGVLGVGFNGDSPVMGSTESYLESLPDFVLKNEIVSPTKFEHQEVQPMIIFKPVIHFYGKEGQKIELTIRVGKGYPIVYYPKPELGITTRAVTGHGRTGNLTQAQSMTWKLGLSKTDPGDLVAPPQGHWWDIARKIPSDYVIMDGEDAGNERFVFYEGTTYEGPSVTASASEGAITVKNGHTAKSSPVVLIINDNDSRTGIYIESVPAGGSVEISKDKLEPWDDAQLFENCRKQWRACGMTPEEAEGIVGCWREELAEKPGFLLISRVPEAIYEKIFPLQMSPKPAELTRACMVFDTLPGQGGRKHWVPSIRKEGQAIIKALAADEFRDRMAARGKLIAMGEIVTPFVDEILADPETDAQSRIGASNVRRLLSESQVCVPALHTDAPEVSSFPVGRELPEIPEFDPLLFPDLLVVPE